MNALILTVFHGLVGEGTSRASSNGAIILQISDCEFEFCKKKATSTSITYWSSNTIPRVSHSPLPYNLKTIAYSVQSLQLFTTSNRGNKDGLLFCLTDGQPVPRYHVSDILWRAISFIGLDNRHFKCHSLRIGTATGLIAQGVPDEQVQRIGRWKSSAFKRYIQIPRYTTIH